MPPERQTMPAVVLVTDRALRLGTAFGPQAMSEELDALRSSTQPLDVAWPKAGRLLRAMRAALRGKRMSFSADLGAVRVDGHAVPLTAPDGEIIGAIAVGIDTADQARLSREIDELREALKHAQSVSSFAYYVVDVATKRVTVSSPFAQIWGLPEGTTELWYEELLERVHHEDRAAFDDFGRGSVQCRIVRPSGEVRHIRTFGSYFPSSNGTPPRSVGSVFDFTEFAQAQNTVQFLTTHDPLTGLLNRHALLEALNAYADQQRNGALVVFDIDRFAQVNELAGHAVGDQLLHAIAERVRFLENDGHYVARLGSDEFACFLMEPADCPIVDRDVERLRDALDAPFTAGHTEIVVRATMGVARHPQHGTGETLLQNAGIALYTAKATMRGGTMAYDPALDRKMSVRSRLERDLANAVRRNEFSMYYQPLIDATSGAVIATEALLRWQHPDLGLLTPDVFLNIAEESDAVVDIGRWAIDRACHDARAIRKEMKSKLRLNVNISPRHVQSTKLVGHVNDALNETGWEPDALQLEVTEQLLIEDIPSAVATLQRLRDAGVSIAIDDFGTGYNTLSYLKSYPVTCLKIDRAFVKDAESDNYSRAICRSVAALADSLEMNVIGEGVETDGQAEFLRGIGCRELQGYKFGRPVTAWDFMTSYT